MNNTQQLLQKDIDLERSMTEKLRNTMTKMMKFISILFIIIGVILCITIVGMFLGLVLIALGFAGYKILPKMINTNIDKKILEIDIRQSQLNDQIGK